LNFWPGAPELPVAMPLVSYQAPMCPVVQNCAHVPIRSQYTAHIMESTLLLWSMISFSFINTTERNLNNSWVSPTCWNFVASLQQKHLWMQNFWWFLWCDFCAKFLIIVFIVWFSNTQRAIEKVLSDDYNFKMTGCTSPFAAHQITLLNFAFTARTPRFSLGHCSVIHRSFLKWPKKLN